MEKTIFIFIITLTTSPSLAWATPEKPAFVSAPKIQSVASAPVVAPASTKVRQIKIKADIKPEELGYKKFFSTYYPDTLKIRANGKEIYSLTNKDKIEAKEITIPVNGDKVVVEYDYEWNMGLGMVKRTGTKRAEFKVNDKIDKLELEFGSWKNDNRMVIPQAKQVGEEIKIK